MNYDILLDLVTDIGYNLAMSGAETFRVEDSIRRVLAAYNVDSDIFSIPNSLIVTISAADGRSITRMKRVGFHGNDLDSVEKYNSLCRRICAEKPDAEIALQWLKETNVSRRHYRLPMVLVGNILAAAGFCIFFGGTLMDALCAALCGVLLGLADRFLEKFKTNQFFRTIATAFIMAMVAYITGALRTSSNTDSVIIGTLMVLVPGMLFTNALRDIIFGDTNSGINRIVQVLLIAAAIALGTGAAWNLSANLFGIPVSMPSAEHAYYIECIAGFVACFGFCFLFNIYGHGCLLCALGGALTWGAFCITEQLGGSALMCNFIGALFAAAYAEIMARIRKYPAISYLVISLLPLFPGAGIYYTTNYLVSGDLSNFAAQGRSTIAIAGVLAVGILMVSTITRLMNVWRQHKR